MFGSFLAGVFAPIIVVLGVVMFIGGLANGAPFAVLLGLGLVVGGNYARYVSKHTTRIR